MRALGLFVLMLAVANMTSAGCDSSNGTPVDSRLGDLAPPSDGQADQAPLSDGQPDQPPLPDGGAPDGPLADASPPDTTVADAAGAGAYLLWQAPGGFVGTGPALEILADGTVHLWSAVFSQQPHKTSGWTASDQLTAAETATLFGLLAQIDYANLPHPGGPWAECYPAFHYEPCSTCSPQTLSYINADSLKPEMDPVYTWLDGRLKSHGVQLPGGYCVFP